MLADNIADRCPKYNSDYTLNLVRLLDMIVGNNNNKIYREAKLLSEDQ